jgi:hypothetical protein
MFTADMLLIVRASLYYYYFIICNGFDPLTVRMNLGLIDRLLVPPNLISAQESPVP